MKFQLKEDARTYYMNNNPAQVAQNRLAWNMVRDPNTAKKEAQFRISRINFAKNQKDLDYCYEEAINYINKAYENGKLSSYMKDALASEAEKAYNNIELNEENELEKRAKFNKSTDKKGARGWFIHPNPGDPEAMNRFNNSVSKNAKVPTNATADGGVGEVGAANAGASAGGGMGESFYNTKEGRVTLQAKSFGYDVHMKGQEPYHIDSAVIVIPNGLKWDSGNVMDATVFAEDENGRVINFKDVEEAQEWIDKYQDRLEFNIKHGDELHATPITEMNEAVGSGWSRDDLIAEIKKYGRKYKFEKYTDQQLFRMLNRIYQEEEEKEQAAKETMKEFSKERSYQDEPKNLEFVGSYQGYDIMFDSTTGDFMIDGNNIKFPTEIEAVEYIDSLEEK